MNSPKKLIEVALPLDAINRESVREKSIRHGHPSTLHLWWARRPLSACRAVLFAQIVDDPSSHPGKFPTEEDQNNERKRLFKIIEELVKWENINNKKVLEAAQQEIMRSTNGNPPPILDPFCGGGSIPLEAQRLGLKTYAGDLNPVAVLITKALIEIPPKFSGIPPVHPGAQSSIQWNDAHGIAEDVRYYGNWIRDKAQKRIGHLYPKVKLPRKYGGEETNVIVWLWTRTIKCPNPACGAQMPLMRSFWLNKKTKSRTWIKPILNIKDKKMTFKIETGGGTPPSPPKIGRGAKFRCLFCDQISEDQHIKDEASAGRMGRKLMAIAAEGPRSIIFLPPNEFHESVELSAKPEWIPEAELAYDPRAIWCTLYGLKTFGDLFTKRQLLALNTFSDLITDAVSQIHVDAIKSGMPDDGKGINDGGISATAYAEAIGTYLAFGVSRSANYWSSLTPWGGGFIVQTFGRQGLPMVWDFAEGNVFSNSTGNWSGAIEWIAKCLTKSIPASVLGNAIQTDATSPTLYQSGHVVCTDPPYYDNIGYADLSDYFYVWMRRSLSRIYPDLFATLLTPKTQEIVAIPYRFGGDKNKARKFFEKNLSKAFKQMSKESDENYPLTIYYAFKQSEREHSIVNGERINTMVSTGWETMLDGLLKTDLQITGTWPLRTERDQGLKTGTNVLASSIVLVCRRRSPEATITTRRDFINKLKGELPDAIKTLQQGNIAPVDLAQAAIGPGMSIFSRYNKVLEADGTPMGVRAALALINQVLEEYITEQEGDYDADTRWTLAWFEQYGMEEGPYGVAETLSKAKNTAVDGLVTAGIVTSKAGKVRILSRNELPDDWDPTSDKRLTVWEVTQQIVRLLVDKGSEESAANLLRKVGALGDTAKELAYRLYTVCDRNKWAQEALVYNSLVVAWPELAKLARQQKPSSPIQEELF